MNGRNSADTALGRRSPLKAPSLRLAGQSLQDAIERSVEDGLVPYLWVAGVLCWAAAMEWWAVWRQIPRLPWLYTALAIAALAITARRFFQVRTQVGRLRLGREGEKAVGQTLELLREDGAKVFHDVLAQGFNLDHVVLGPRGFFVIETKTRSKPVGREARVTLTADSVLVDGYAPDRCPVRQAQAGATWLAEVLAESTGRAFPVRGVVVYPGWFVERMSPAWKRAGLPWVLEPKALAGFIAHEPVHFSREDVYLAASHLSRFIRSREVERTDRLA
jgi:hypothetical protein